ncbi:MAG: succinate dehydrogenase, hydrophobic membrane anchor protein [Rhodospirillales bacterium RIFCSPLOWO2_12_FULL_58_28]|nr:MAG: succinate dehydrogenase, hydrophobic membrane anchor protein [Rhodospirillales bacterium RIFCSPLOWO2_02_FULL_58_16]OHC76870.1 MAG: succinate dehydrogenase, hydrophobic membrane anchor protein [Rhodospirillales bacterium RIFCSPLOWO2_12_FULL_58_28]
MKMRSALGRVRGHGSARAGTEGWYTERLTALALVPLAVWFVAFMVSGVGADYATFRAWMAMPGNMAMTMLLLIVSLWHGALALSVVIEDYVHNKTIEIAGLIAVKFGALALGVFAVGVILKIGLGS